MAESNKPKKDSSLTQEDVINQILSSIAMEGLGLRQTISPESEKNRYTLRNAKDVPAPEPRLAIRDLLALNKSVRKTLDNAVQNQLLLKGGPQATMQNPMGAGGLAAASVDQPVSRVPHTGRASSGAARTPQKGFMKFEMPKSVPGASGHAKSTASSLAIIPFSARSVIIRANAQGKAMDVCQMSFGSTALPAIPVNGDGTITVPGYQQLSFSLPYDSVIKGVYVSAGNNSTLYGPEMYYPYVELYFAPTDSNTFAPVAGSAAIPEEGISVSTPYDVNASAANTGLSIHLSAGTQVIIGAKLKTENPTGNRSIHARFTGGIAISPLLTVQGVSP